MITFEKENIINVKAEALVNSVNLKGVMGKGVALAFKETYRKTINCTGKHVRKEPLI